MKEGNRHSHKGQRVTEAINSHRHNEDKSREWDTAEEQSMAELTKKMRQGSKYKAQKTDGYQNKTES